MREELARQHILNHLRVTRSDIAEAKAFVLGRDEVEVQQWLIAWAHHHTMEFPERIPIRGLDPTPALDLAARWLSLRLCLLEAVLDLYRVGLPLAASSQDHVWQMDVGWTDGRPGQSGTGGAWTFGELAVRTPTRQRRPWWAGTASQS